MEVADRVTVICIAFNHEKWIEDALESVRLQSHGHIELIIVDNGSIDHTPSRIGKWVTENADRFPVEVIYKSVPEPYCQLFNEVLDQVESAFVVDLSGDDSLYADHLSLSIGRIQQEPNAAFVFSDAVILDERGREKTFYRRNASGGLLEKILEGDIYEKLIRESYISSPTVVFNTAVLKQAGGYDSALSYEDFDVQLRLARDFPVVFSDHIGVLKRKHGASLSAGQYRRYQSQMLPSTLRVCGKIREMNRSVREDAALSERILFELKHALWSANFQSAEGFVRLAKVLKVDKPVFWLYRIWLRLRIDLSWLYVKLT